jgi:transcriptional regulator with XRE-family HTH domain
MDFILLIATRLRQLRHRHGLTQQEFAELAGLGFKFYQQLESGRKKQIWLETIVRLAEPYGLEPWQFLSPQLPDDTQLTHKVVESSVHYGTRKGPYRKPPPRADRGAKES